MPVLTHVVKIPQSLYFHNRQLNVRFSKLNYDDGSKYGFIQNETFLDNLSFSYIVNELISKQKKCNSLTSTTGEFVCPSNNFAT